MINIGISASGVSINDYQKQKKISALHPIDLSFCDQRSESLTGASTEYKPTKHDKFCSRKMNYHDEKSSAPWNSNVGHYSAGITVSKKNILQV